MRSARVPAETTKATFLVMTVLALTSTAAAFAGDSGKLEVTPGTVRPGAAVTVNTTACGRQGHGQGDASALGGPSAFELKPGAHEPVATGRFVVPDNALPGTYGLGVQCDNGKETVGDVVVAPGNAPATATAEEQAPLTPGMAQPHPPRAA